MEKLHHHGVCGQRKLAETCANGGRGERYAHYAGGTEEYVGVDSEETFEGTLGENFFPSAPQSSGGFSSGRDQCDEKPAPVGEKSAVGNANEAQVRQKDEREACGYVYDVDGYGYYHRIEGGLYAEKPPLYGCRRKQGGGSQYAYRIIVGSQLAHAFIGEMAAISISLSGMANASKARPIAAPSTTARLKTALISLWSFLPKARAVSPYRAHAQESEKPNVALNIIDPTAIAPMKKSASRCPAIAVSESLRSGTVMLLTIAGMLRRSISRLIFIASAKLIHIPVSRNRKRFRTL